MAKNKEKKWLPIKQAVEEGKITNKWGNPAQISWYYRLIEKGKLESRVNGNSFEIYC